MSKKKLFIILTTQRSGSTFLREWLNTHYDIRCHEELFLHDYTGTESFRNYLENYPFGKKLSYRLKDYKKISGFWARFYLHRFINSVMSETPPGMPPESVINESKERLKAELSFHPWVGFKLMANQLSLIDNLSYELCKRDVHVVNLRRANKLDNYVSRVVAIKRGIYHTDRTLPPITIELDPGVTVQEIRSYAEQETKARHFFVDRPQIDVFYENFFNPDRTEPEMERVLNFLGLSMEKLGPPPKLVKIVNQPVKDVVGNYDQIIEALQKADLL